jgi:hypothetical protein
MPVFSKIVLSITEPYPAWKNVMAMSQNLNIIPFGIPADMVLGFGD